MRGPGAARRARALALILLAAASGAGSAEAHGFGQRYDLPLPLPMWLGGAGASILLSFVVVALFQRSAAKLRTDRGLDLLTSPLGRFVSSAPVVAVLRAVSVGLWGLAIAAGLFGRQDAYLNITPTLVWVIGWVGVSFASIFLGDIWAVFNPLGALFKGADAAIRRLTGKRPNLGWRLPPGVGVWPAAAMFAAFAWLELVWSASDVPSSLARILAVYSLVTAVGMFVFGRECWLARAEFFSVAFGVLARFAPFELRPTTDSRVRSWKLRAPGVGLLDRLPLPASEMVFVLLMLATVTFDGFLETRQWLDTADRMSIAKSIQPLLGACRALGLTDDEALSTIGFAAFPLLFVAVALAGAWLARRSAIGPGGASAVDVPSTSRIARSLVATLVPISIAYHLAHYLSMLAIAGQYIIPLASDPFGFGWNLFGTAAYRVDIGVVGVRFVWYFAAIAIVSGHVVAVVLAHSLALREFPTRRAALWSQLPWLVLMVGYTVLSLWILAQPIVE